MMKIKMKFYLKCSLRFLLLKTANFGDLKGSFFVSLTFVVASVLHLHRKFIGWLSMNDFRFIYFYPFIPFNLCCSRLGR